MSAQIAKRKVAFILPNFNAGGAERVMITVANHIDREKFKPLLVVFDDQGPLRSLVAADIDIHVLHAPRVSRGFFKYIDVIRALRPDVIISTMVHLNLMVLLAKIFIPSVPVIVREAVTPSYFSGSKLKSLVLGVGYRILYPWAAHVVSPTALVFDEMPASLKKKDKLVRIFNPVDLDHVKAAYDVSLRSLYATPAQKLFVASGRLVDQKGFDLLIRSLSDWRHRDDWRLLILGEGPDRKKLQDMIDQNDLSQISLLGFQADPWQFCAVADAFLLPSRHEGLPNVALEALAMGAPVIASSSAGGIAEIGREAELGAVQIVRDMPEFLEEMNRVAIRSPERASLLPEAFSKNAVIKSYEELLS